MHLHTYFFTGEDMTQDEVLKMARRAGYFIYDLTETHKKKTVETDEADEWAQLERFAKLVAQHERKRIESRPWGACKECMALAVEGEREACAKVAEWEPCMTDTPHRIASAIRARGQA